MQRSIPPDPGNNSQIDPIELATRCSITSVAAGLRTDNRHCESCMSTGFSESRINPRDQVTPWISMSWP